AGGDAAADVAARLKWRVLPDLGDRNLGEHGKVGEGRAAHIVIDGLTLVAETRGTIGHQSLALRRADRSAKVGLARKAAFALTAFGGVERYLMLARLHAGHARADLAHDSGALMPQYAREDALAVDPVQRIGVSVADACRHDLDQHLARLLAFKVKLDDFEGLFRFKRNSSTGFHRPVSFLLAISTPRR